MPVADALSRAAAFDVQNPSPNEAASHVRELGNLFAELDTHALHEIENQFHRNAFDWVQRQAKRLGSVSPEFQVGDLVLELKASSTPLRGKARGPLTLTSGSTQFKDKRDFDKSIGLLSKYFDKQSNRSQQPAMIVAVNTKITTS